MVSKALVSIKIGLKLHQYQLLNDVILSNPLVERAWVFGSRALGTFKESSDIDIALEGQALTLNEIAMMLDTLDQSSLPYKVDLLIKHKITSPELLTHIEQHGLQIK
ncbi:nucleotidyltransferase family protein [Vibrio aestuarianus]|uniref:Nucleotidyltransferase domain-containing protein n=1 Tax=Vibrio aestuarianus TaxID=28171 RepID=A0ABD7YKU8_9VIBR|nr:nucleotidyltransferase domain-containing protein [Vibrio aestuarianus]MDE1230911.1 nucleotidyltransferase domain-containing protein [Vibrio aestuarianus]MDE1309895.1 nucleotidyltransferase domain-containing protein [Vibrio aestuarianus]MDE1327153.1 nucleotidyltransferase domain-containing protein [Vibrio aestuarianus]MDE1335094.1 nucleotidyltransferase domain-containing protein [Vibrio aestuarianus]NGZ19334.1 nucleotidyltransferase domain-containing protein [Vibrio aestuarianus]